MSRRLVPGKIVMSKPFVIVALLAWLGLAPTTWCAAKSQSIKIQVSRDVVFDGQCVVVTATAKTSAGAPISGLKLRALVNGKPWCASETTLPSGVAHLLLPLPEVGANVIIVRGGKVTSSPVTVQVKRRRFRIITNPNHLIGMEYETWFGPGYAQWGRTSRSAV